ncbi:MAG: DUF1059 domain-containing protein [Omnitrophica WOR_2 bacterium GWA2_47_8]|nr:MAG: DUF1059 domain-containing protein [Omnitrophica WOR_2 bacterium GWA2_47_8]
MKTMTCKMLGGACDEEFHAATFEEIADLSKRHGMRMLQKGDQMHLDAMNKMRALMENPEDMNQWLEGKRKEFDALSESS